MQRAQKTILWLGILSLLVGVCMAQRGRGRGGYRSWGGESYIPNPDAVRTAREVESHSMQTPVWTNKPAFDKDVFTFVRVRYSRSQAAYRSAGLWMTDFPD